MKFSISHFEQYIDEPILKRGLSYFKNNHVGEFQKTAKGEVSAVVAGNNHYSVKLLIHQGIVEEHVCNCPYDLGPVCKHIVAVLFFLQQGELGIKPKSAVKSTTGAKVLAKPKRKTAADKAEDILGKITHEELLHFVRNQIGQNDPLRKALLFQYSSSGTGESKKHYASQIKAILRKGKGRLGFLDRRSVSQVGNEVTDLLGEAKRQVNSQQYQTGIFMAAAVLEEMTKALDYADDSNADIGHSINLAFGLLEEIASLDLPRKDRVVLFNYCLSSNKSNCFKGWDWHLGVLDIAINMSSSEEEAQQILHGLEQVEGSVYEISKAQELTYKLLARARGPGEAEKYLQQNLANNKFREMAIDMAIEGKDFKRATTLANEGIRLHSAKWPGLVHQWQKCLLRIAQAQKEKNTVIELARQLLFEYSRDEMFYYETLRENIPAKQWKKYVEGLIKQLSPEVFSRKIDLMAAIYIREAWWDKLLQLLRENPRFQYLDEYGPYLADAHSDVLVAIYVPLVRDAAQTSSDRRAYQEVCRYLRKVKKLGGGKTAEYLIAEFKQQFAHRPAFQQELARV